MSIPLLLLPPRVPADPFPSTEDDKDYYYTYSLSSGGYVRAGLMSELDIDDPEPEEAPAPLPPRRAPATGWYTQPVLRTIVRMHDEGTLLPAATAFFVVLWALLMVVIWKFVPPMEGARSRPKRR